MMKSNTSQKKSSTMAKASTAQKKSTSKEQALSDSESDDIQHRKGLQSKKKLELDPRCFTAQSLIPILSLWLLRDLRVQVQRFLLQRSHAVSVKIVSKRLNG